MEQYVIVKIGRTTEEQYERFKRLLSEHELPSGNRASGSAFVGDVTVHVAASYFTLELAVRILRAACIPYSLHMGKTIGRRKKKSGQSTQSQMMMAALMSESQNSPTEDCTSTTPESVSQPQEDGGKQLSG